MVDYPWSLPNFEWQLRMTVHRCHKWYEGNKLDGTRGISACDYSGTTPDQTDDGVLWLDETQVIRIESEDTYANDRKQFFKWCSVVKIVAHDYEGNVTSIGGTNGAEVYELVKAFGIRAEHVDILTDEVTEIKP